MEKRTIVLVGGVAVGATAAARLRRLNEQDEIIILERNGYMSFANCGLPYYLGGVIQDRAELLLQTPESFKARYNVDVKVYHEVLSINKDTKTLTVKETKTGNTYEQSYDKLILGPGADPIVPPFTGLTEAKNVFTLRNMEHTDAIFDFLKANPVKKAVVVGGGFIGLEVAENFREKGIDVTLVDLSPQVMNPADPEIAQVLQNEMELHGTKFLLGEAVDSFSNEGKTVTLKSGVTLESDITILAIGVRPATRFIASSGIAMDERSGAIIVDEYMRTSDKDIYAAGDAVMINSAVDGVQTLVPLASPANRQARLIGDHINGITDCAYKGAIGTSVIKIHNLTFSSTGFNEKQLKQKNMEYKMITLHRGNHAGYYPGSSVLTLKVMFNPTTGQIWGAQAVGAAGVEKRIDVIATAMNFGAKAWDLDEVELAYAPPYSSAKDPVNVVGYAVQNMMEGIWSPVSAYEVDELVANGAVLLDVRTEEEYAEGAIPGSINIPIDELRSNLAKLEQYKGKQIIATCMTGQRAYLAIQILHNNGFKNLSNLMGAWTTYKVVKGIK